MVVPAFDVRKLADAKYRLLSGIKEVFKSIPLQSLGVNQYQIQGFMTEAEKAFSDPQAAPAIISVYEEISQAVRSLELTAQPGYDEIENVKTLIRTFVMKVLREISHFDWFTAGLYDGGIKVALDKPDIAIHLPTIYTSLRMELLKAPPQRTRAGPA